MTVFITLILTYLMGYTDGKMAGRLDAYRHMGNALRDTVKIATERKVAE